MGCSNSKDANTQNAMAFDVPSRAELDSRIECSEKPESAILGGAKVRYAYLSQRGYYPDDPNKANQDALSITTKFASVTNDAFLGVYDGHGKHGEKCSQFTKKRLPEMVARLIVQERMKEPEASMNGCETDSSINRLHDACNAAHHHCNLALHRDGIVDDTLSGTTSISAYFHGPRNRVTICNVGDSRAIMGTRKNDRKSTVSPLRAQPLSRDQTPYRKDERQRVKECGARILSLDQIEGLEPEMDGEWNDATELDLGEEIDEWGDPPRVWSPHGEYPGTAFTRSIGDSIAEELGVTAEPEIITRELSDDDKIIVLASDGVFEFLTNQSVIDICAKFQCPLEACRAVVAEAYELWLQYELRTDDISVICIFLDGRVDTAFDDALELSVRSKSDTQCETPTNGDVEMPSPGDYHDDLVPMTDVKPVRTLPSKMSLVNQATKKSMRAGGQNKPWVEEEEDDIDISALSTKKTDEEKKLISEAVKASVMFRNLSPEQKELVYDVMEPISVKKGDWVIKQGSTGEKYYIVDNGTYEVRIVPDDQKVEDRPDGGDCVHVYIGSRDSHAHPCFGELALMHEAPRAASVIAQTDGHLWALHRAAFRHVLKRKTERKGLMRALRKVDSLRCLTSDEIETLANSADEISYDNGQIVLNQGEIDCSFYFVISGTLDCVREQSPIEDGEDSKIDKKALVGNNYFGGKSLFGEATCAFTASAKESAKCFKVTKKGIEGTVVDFYSRRAKFEER